MDSFVTLLVDTGSLFPSRNCDLQESTQQSTRALEGFLASVEAKAFRIAQIALRHEDDALDAVQDAMLRLVRSYSSRPPEEWRPLFYRILENCVRDMQRRRSVRGRVMTWYHRAFGDDAVDDESDPLESGIDIMASPPGKRLQNVALLSGGEKSLTAMALLMAIFRYSPSPFCILDEVDAPLDEPNIQRLTRLIKEMSHDTQFIVITHAKRTMEVAQALYGVTMQEPGLSKLVSVRFEPIHNDVKEAPVAAVGV